MDSEKKSHIRKRKRTSELADEGEMEKYPNDSESPLKKIKREDNQDKPDQQDKTTKKESDTNEENTRKNDKDSLRRSTDKERRESTDKYNNKDDRNKRDPQRRSSYDDRDNGRYSRRREDRGHFRKNKDEKDYRGKNRDDEEKKKEPCDQSNSSLGLSVEEKRKLLWSGKKKTGQDFVKKTATTWADSQMGDAEKQKFFKLMGMKDEEIKKVKEVKGPSEPGQIDKVKNDLEKQYHQGLAYNAPDHRKGLK